MADQTSRYAAGEKRRIDAKLEKLYAQHEKGAKALDEAMERAKSEGLIANEKPKVCPICMTKAPNPCRCHSCFAKAGDPHFLKCKERQG